MGMFDSVIHICSCGGVIEWQSKADECVLAKYRPTEVPVKIANEINGTIEKCNKCGKEYEISGWGLPQEIEMHVKEI